MKDKEAGTIVIQNLQKSFEDSRVLENVSLSIPAGSRAVLYGPSGSGKSTLLRLIAGIIEPDQGEIHVDRRHLSFVFQDNELFGWLSAMENIMSGLDCRKAEKKEREKKARAWAAYFHCESLLDQRTDTLSGGQRKRVALARAFMKDPQILLLDESFSSLDLALKEQLSLQLLSLQKQKKMTMIMVTHSFEEASRMGEEIFFLQDGKVLSHGNARDLAKNPQTLFETKAAEIPGMNILPASWFGKTGFAGIAPGACSLTKQSGWIELNGECLDWLSYGKWQVARFLVKDVLISILCDEKKEQNSVWINPEKIVWFDEQGYRLKHQTSLPVHSEFIK